MAGIARQCDGEVICFIVEWFDNHAQIQRQYQLKYFLESDEIEMFDLKSRKVFLKRSSKPAGLSANDLYIGSQIVIHSRTLLVKDYGDNYTRNKLETMRQKSVMVIKPDSLDYMGQIVDMVLQDGFTVSKLKMVKLSRDEASEMFLRHQGTGYFDSLVQQVTSNTVVVMEVVANDAINKLQRLVGIMRSKFGTNDVENVAAIPENDLEAVDMTRLFFGPQAKFAPTAVYDNCSCCVVRPHAVRAGLTGKVLDAILREGFEVSALWMTQLDRAASTELLEVYKGVVPTYSEMVTEMASGPAVAMELRAAGAVSRLRELAGPWDVEMARDLRPNTIRGRYGVDRVKNVVHCTDLEEDAVLECQYFFDILANR